MIAKNPAMKINETYMKSCTFLCSLIEFKPNFNELLTHTKFNFINIIVVKVSIIFTITFKLIIASLPVNLKYILLYKLTMKNNDFPKLRTISILISMKEKNLYKNCIGFIDY